MAAPGAGFDAAVFAWVSGIRRGRVVAYGQVATALGSPRAARAVGYALARLRAKDRVPWWRVVNAQGRISVGGAPLRPELQRQLLEAEGVEFDAAGCIDLQRFGDARPRPAAQVVSDAAARRLR